METQVRTPQTVFMQPQRLVVPLFQRPYVWNEEKQWEPLWDDVTRVAERFLNEPHEKHYPHFLGAVVLQQVQNPAGTMQVRTIIDGQQRLTTLQLLFDALQGELVRVNATAPAMRLETLVRNADPFCRHPEDRFKVWPTNRDRASFNAIMASPPDDDSADGELEEEDAAAEIPRRPHLITAQELRAAGALDVPPSWRTSLGPTKIERDLFSDLVDD